MAEKSVALRYSERLVEYVVAVCKDRREGLLPSHVESHSHRIDGLKQKEARHIADSMRDSSIKLREWTW